MAVLTRTRKFEKAPIKSARAKRQRFPWYFEMDSSILFMVGVALLALTCLLYLLQTSRVSLLGYEIQNVQAQQDEQTRISHNLQYELDSRESLSSVRSYATKKLKMHPVTGDYEYVTVNLTAKEIEALQSRQHSRSEGS